MLLTLGETLDSQNNLHELCADRQLKTCEIFAPNAFYGIDYLVKTYAGLSQDYPLKVVIPHGLVLSETFLWDAEIHNTLPMIWCYPPYRHTVYANRVQEKKKVLLSASPFLYVCELLQDHLKPPRAGTIFFLNHSSHRLTAQMEFGIIAEELTAIDDAYQPVTVCLYWRDFELDRHKPFQKRGLRVVSAGHMYDPMFLFRLYHICSLHQYASSILWGSHLFYAVKAGCSFFMLQSKSTHHSIAENESILQQDGHRDSHKRMSEILSLFQTPPHPSSTPEQMKETDYFLGAAYLKPPDELRRQLFMAEALYRTRQIPQYLSRGMLALWHPKKLMRLVGRFFGQSVQKR